LFFSTLGRVYRMKVWRLPEGGANTRGRPMINLLPLAEGETISTVLPLPEDEAEWGKLHVMFATAKGSVRRNSMDAFTSIRTAGKIAMKFEGEDEDDRLIGVALLDEEDDVLLATRQGKAIRFAGTEVREFQSRDSTGVRGMRLSKGDEVISLSILHRVGVKDQDEREDYLRHAAWKSEDTEGVRKPRDMDDARFVYLGEREQFDNIARNGPVVASFPASKGHQLMLVTDQAKLIRMSLGDLRVIGRNSAGVRLFNVADDEHVVSAARIEETEGDAEADLTTPEDRQVAPDPGADTADDSAAGPVDGQ
jgi:DNA gyrase subunit A